MRRGGGGGGKGERRRGRGERYFKRREVGTLKSYPSTEFLPVSKPSETLGTLAS